MTAQPTLTLTETGNLRIHIPMHIRRMRGRKMIFAPQALDGGVPDSSSEVQGAVVQALARAFSWSEAIENGEFSSVAELARHLDIDNSYVARILKLTTLAPDIIEAILNGEEPSGLSLARLIRTFPWAGSSRESCSDSPQAEPPPAVADGPGPAPIASFPHWSRQRAMWTQLIEGSSNPFPILVEIVPRPLPLSNWFDSLFRASYIIGVTSDIVGADI